MYLRARSVLVLIFSYLLLHAEKKRRHAMTGIRISSRYFLIMINCVLQVCQLTTEPYMKRKVKKILRFHLVKNVSTCSMQICPVLNDIIFAAFFSKVMLICQGCIHIYSMVWNLTMTISLSTCFVKVICLVLTAIYLISILGF